MDSAFKQRKQEERIQWLKVPFEISLGLSPLQASTSTFVNSQVMSRLFLLGIKKKRLACY
jgi:hypothetical protein